MKYHSILGNYKRKGSLKFKSSQFHLHHDDGNDLRQQLWIKCLRSKPVERRKWVRNYNFL